MRGYALLRALKEVIRLLLDYPQGLSVLIGSVDPPDAVELYSIWQMLRSSNDNTRVKTSRGAQAADIMIDKAESFNIVVNNSGGWEHINAITQEYRKRYATTWQIITRAVSLPASRIDGATYDEIAENSGVSRGTVLKVIGRFPYDLAAAILNTPLDTSGSGISSCQGQAES